MIPPLNIEYPKIVGNTMYTIAGGAIIEEDISLAEDDIKRLKEELCTCNE